MEGERGGDIEKDSEGRKEKREGGEKKER